MGGAKYERVNRRDDDYTDDQDEEHEVELGNRTSMDYGEGSSNQTASTPSPINHNKHASRTTAGDYRIRTGGVGGKGFKNKEVMTALLKTGLAILLYFSLSIGLTFYQSSLLKKFNYPLLVVLYHLIMKYTLAGIFRIIYRLVTGRQRVQIDCKSSLKIAPVGLASGIDIGFSNWGLELVKISLYTMTKSTTIVFILIFSIILKLEKKSWSLASIVVLISGGLFLFTYKASQFNVLGFTFILISSLSSGIRWSFAQVLMQRSKIGLHHPIDMIYHMQPWMMVAIIPSIAIFERTKIIAGYATLEDSSFDDILLMFLKVTIGAVLAFGMEVSEFLVLSRTSSLTLSVSGVLKEIIQLILAVNLAHDQLSPLNIVGLMLCLGGIGCHVAHKYSVYKSDGATSKSLSSQDPMGEDGLGPDDPESSFQFRYRNRNGGGGHIPDQSPLLETDEDEDVHLFQAKPVGTPQGRIKKPLEMDKESADDIIFDVVQRRER